MNNIEILKTLFPVCKDYTKLKYDEIGLYSITSLKTASIITEIIKAYFPTNYKDLIITDATAGLGGNVLNFSDNFKSINAIEKDSKRFNYMKENINMYRNENYDKYNNITFYNKNYIEIMDILNQDIIFIDAPWSGPNYKIHKSIDLFIEKYNLFELCNMLEKQAKLIVCKVPINFNFNDFITNINNKKINIYKLTKMNLIVIRNTF